MKIEYKESDIDFIAEFDSRLCLLYQDSGVGKTFLFKTLQKAICEDWHSRYYYYNYINSDKILSNRSVYLDSDNIIVFDDAGLYNDIVSRVLEESNATIVIFTKSLGWLGKYNEKFGRYRIEQTEDSVIMRRFK